MKLRRRARTARTSAAVHALNREADHDSICVGGVARLAPLPFLGYFTVIRLLTSSKLLFSRTSSAARCR